MTQTYTTLKADIQAYVEDDGTEFQAALDRIIQNTELRIYREADLDVFRKSVTATWPAGSQFITKPADIVVDRFMSVAISSNEVYLQGKDVSFIQSYWPNPATQAAPKYYADWDHDTFVVAPTFDDSYLVTLAYTYRPESIVTAATSWLGTNAPDVLLYGCLIEALGFLKNYTGPALVFWKEEYARAMGALKLEEERRQRREEQRWGGETVITETDKAYLAGLFDGEGCIASYKNHEQRGKNKITYSLTITITNTNMEVLKWVQNKFGGRIHEKIKTDFKDCYTWAVSTTKGKPILKQMLPYLIVKKLEAELALIFPVGKGPFSLTKEMKQEQKNICKQLRYIKGSAQRNSDYLKQRNGSTLTIADTWTTNLRLTKMEEGARDDTWGAGLNDEVIDMIEDALTAETSLTYTGGTDVLTTNNGSADESRNLFLDCSGTLVSNQIIEIPNKNKLYVVRNGTSGAFTLSVKTNAGSALVITQGETIIIYCDGADVVFEMASPPLAIPSQAEAEAGTATVKRVWTAERVKQAIAALETETIVFPTGTTMVFYQSAAPTGWTKDVASILDDHALRIVTDTAWASGSNGTSDFSTVFGKTATDSHTLTSAQSGMPAHGHTLDMGIGSNSHAGVFARRNDSTNGAVSNTVNNATGVNASSGHSHNIELRVKYVNVILAVKD